MQSLSLKFRWILLISCLGIMVGLSMASGGWVSTVQAQSVPSPTPTWTPWPGPWNGGVILVCVPRPPRDAWAGVQWQDKLGQWHDIESWLAVFDGRDAPFRSGEVCTRRWVGRPNFGEKPFRWVIYYQRGGGIWGFSRPFSFPDTVGQWVWAEMPATPPDLASPTPTPQGATGACVGTHVVRSGENLFRIGYNCGFTVRQMAVRNGLRFPYIVYPGQVLRFP